MLLATLLCVSEYLDTEHRVLRRVELTFEFSLDALFEINDTYLSGCDYGQVLDFFGLMYLILFKGAI